MTNDVRQRFVADVVAFCAVGISSTTQFLTHVAAGEASDDLEVIAEETLALVSRTTAQVVSFVLSDHEQLASSIIPALSELPLRYYDFILGNQMLEDIAGGEDVDTDAADSAYTGLSRKMDFYTSHFPLGQYPGRKLLDEKMQLWMGRISAPGLAERPTERTVRLGVADVLSRHLHLVRSFINQMISQTESDSSVSPE